MDRNLATHPYAAARPARLAAVGEGRDCERSRRLTALVLFPKLDWRPGAWLLFLTSVCTFVAVRALEMGPF
jgi:hypothetical protein